MVRNFAMDGEDRGFFGTMKRVRGFTPGGRSETLVPNVILLYGKKAEQGREAGEIKQRTLGNNDVPKVAPHHSAGCADHHVHGLQLRGRC